MFLIGDKLFHWAAKDNVHVTEDQGSERALALVHGYRRGGILRDVGLMFTVAITGVCRAVQV